MNDPYTNLISCVENEIDEMHDCLVDFGPNERLLDVVIALAKVVQLKTKKNISCMRMVGKNFCKMKSFISTKLLIVKLIQNEEFFRTYCNLERET